MNMWAILLFLIAGLIFLLPVMVAIGEWHFATDAQPLDIIQDHDGSVRHFAERFKALITRELDEIRRSSGGAPNHCLVDVSGLLELTTGEVSHRTLRRVLVSDGSLVLPNDFTFEREVYGRGRVTTGLHDRLCAVLADDELEFSRGATVSRWAHARVIRAARDCVFSGRLSAESEISLEEGCTFSRANAPTIHFTRPAGGLFDSDALILSGQGRKAAVTRVAFGLGDDRWISEGDLTLPEECVFRGDLVVHGDLLVGRNVEIEGRVKVHGRTRLEEGVAIGGTLVGEGSVTIGLLCKVAGPLISEDALEIGAGTIVGTRALPTTVTATSIRIAPGTVVHGTVWAHHNALVVNGGTRA